MSKRIDRFGIVSHFSSFAKAKKIQSGAAGPAEGTQNIGAQLCGTVILARITGAVSSRLLERNGLENGMLGRSCRG
jgi:hypothetical protein